MIDPNAPPEWLIFVLFTGMLCALLAIMKLISGLKRMSRGETFWDRDRADRVDRPTARRSTVRSTALKSRFNRSNSVRGRSPLPNAEKTMRSGVQTFTDRSNVQHSAPPIMADIPTSIDEMQRLAHTITLYAKRPNKEIAILEAWGATKGDGDVYTRASRLFDAAMSDAARQALKAKGPQIAREVEAA